MTTLGHKVIVLGSTGMLGHMVKKYLEQFYQVETIEYRWPTADFLKAIKESNADYLINCIGAIPQRTKNFDINFQLPIWLDRHFNGKIIHPGTDCEMDDDAYGLSKSKASSWLSAEGSRTKIIKTSIIGFELNGGNASLMEWFLSNRDGSEVNGYINHRWNGSTTLQWAKHAHKIIEDWDNYGKQTVIGTDSLSKWEILQTINDIFNRNIKVNQHQTDEVNKCLDLDINYGSLSDQIKEMKEYYETKNLKIEKPKRIAICFFSTDSKRVEEQMKQIEKVKQRFDFEIWSRADIGDAPFLSFSQLVNEAIISTESEFMIFINPKSELKDGYIDQIITDLCSGLCWVGKQSFGVWGTTKELYRHIGLMDENFIGGEYEDDDFALRLKMFGKAIRWDFDSEMYMYTDSPLGKFRGSSRTYYGAKWRQIEQDVYVFNYLLPPVKKLPKMLQMNKPDISQSWLDWEYSKSDEVSHVWCRAKRASFREIKLKEVRDRSIFKIKISDGSLRVEFLCNTPTLVSFQLAVAERGAEIQVTDRIDLISNRLYEQQFNPVNSAYEVRLYHDGVPIFYDRLAMLPYENEINIGLSIFSYDFEKDEEN